MKHETLSSSHIWMSYKGTEIYLLVKFFRCPISRVRKTQKLLKCAFSASPSPHLRGRLTLNICMWCRPAPPYMSFCRSFVVLEAPSLDWTQRTLETRVSFPNSRSLGNSSSSFGATSPLLLAACHTLDKSRAVISVSRP